jgi:hypothetical protein
VEAVIWREDPMTVDPMTVDPMAVDPVVDMFLANRRQGPLNATKTNPKARAMGSLCVAVSRFCLVEALAGVGEV